MINAPRIVASSKASSMLMESEPGKVETGFPGQS
jgi:hypothetical protein